mmetsp:Transcript_21191/g.46231  ORF Transcript_21191/g.46231 Transcript_21191/m.46231 type:complete len:83 (-) Transcript_21191:1123-1371(-)
MNDVRLARTHHQFLASSLRKRSPMIIGEYGSLTSTHIRSVGQTDSIRFDSIQVPPTHPPIDCILSYSIQSNVNPCFDDRHQR